MMQYHVRLIVEHPYNIGVHHNKYTTYLWRGYSFYVSCYRLSYTYANAYHCKTYISKTSY